MRRVHLIELLVAICLFVSAGVASLAQAADAGPLSPAALAAAPGGGELYIACASTNLLLVVDPVAGKVSRTIPLPGRASGVAVSADGSRLFVTGSGPASQAWVLDARDGGIEATLPAGHSALGPVVGPHGANLYVCSRFDNAITVFDLATNAVTARIRVAREPVSAALTPDGRQLFVANHLPTGPATAPEVAASVSVIDTAARMLVKEIHLPNGSIDLREIRVSPDGRFACVAHVLARFQVPTLRVERGWINCNALTVIDVGRREVMNTVLLDDADRGAANPWAVAWSADGRWLCVTHAGTHELSVIDWPALIAKLRRAGGDVSNDLAFMAGVRRRVQLRVAGPRALAIAGTQAFVAGYFSDSLDVIDLAADAAPVAFDLTPENVVSNERLGEMLFNDATICYQGWQSCASCHGDDGRTDALNWDLPNDGIGNPKKARSLLFAHRTPPVMSLGIRATSGVAVRAGIRNSLFSVLPEEAPAAIDAWVASLRPVPSPHLIDGAFSPAARRGEQLFQSRRTGCLDCHSGGLFTDLRTYDVGTRGIFDRPEDRFDTPTLAEVWRTAPYLHDGSAATLRDVITTHNLHDEHGATSKLTPMEIEDLLAYLLSI